MAAVPYSSIVDSTIVVKESELKDLYNKKKEQFKQYQESRDIKYIDVQVTASAEDRAAIQQEVDEATAQLATTTDDYTSFIRSVGSEAPYVDLFYNKTAFPSDVVARLDSASVGSVYGPYIMVPTILSIHSKWLQKQLLPTQSSSVRFRCLQKTL